MPLFKDFRFWPEGLPRDVVVSYGNAVQLIAAADGQLTIAERELFFDDARRRRIPEDILREWAEYHWEDDTLDEVIKTLKPLLSNRLRKILLFDAIRIALEDADYPLEEQDAVRRAADILEIDDRFVAELEVLASLDKNVTDMKRLAFMDAD